KGNSTAYSLAAACYILQDEFREGENYYKKACKLGPNNPQIHTNYATALAQKGKRYKALEIYKAALKIQENNFEALHYMGLIYCELGKFEDAEETLEKALKVESGNPVTYFYLAVCKFRLEKPQECLELVEKALELRPNYSDCMMIKGVALAKIGKEAECISCFSANEKGQETNAQYYTYWGISLQVFGRYAEAKEKFLQAFELNREDEYNLFYLAENYIKEGNSTPALQLYIKIVEKNNNNAVAHEKIGDILYRKGDYKGAINYYMNGIVLQ
ncbi:MAG: tetratricopeptide repeat protein, partial [bacterium]|nr:tetratricopeptide repeat protein [bacterium]